MKEDLEDRRAESERRLRRHRKRRTPEEQGVFEPDGSPNPFHDVLVIGPEPAQDKGEFYRVPAVKIKGSLDAQGRLEPEGAYIDPPEKWDAYDYAQRRTMTIATPQDWGASAKRETRRGPAFGTLPVKREPAATACVACYLVNAQNFTHRNAWTAEEWNDIGGVDLPPAHRVADPAFEVLLAGPRGKVFYLNVALVNGEGESLWEEGDTEELSSGRGALQCLDLRHEMEIWNQLRNGAVVGTVLSYSKAIQAGKALTEAQTVPLVNLTSLVPEPTTESNETPARRAARG